MTHDAAIGTAVPSVAHGSKAHCTVGRFVTGNKDSEFDLDGDDDVTSTHPSAGESGKRSVLDHVGLHAYFRELDLEVCLHAYVKCGAPLISTCDLHVILFSLALLSTAVLGVRKGHFHFTCFKMCFFRVRAFK